MNRVIRLVSCFAVVGLTLGISGCKESDEMPTKPLVNGQILTTPNADPTFEEAVKYAYNLGNRAATKPRQAAADALDKVEKKLRESKPADMDKKLEQIQACRTRIVAIGEWLRVQAIYNKYVLPNTGPGVSVADAEAKLQKAGDPQYLKLKADLDAAVKKNKEADDHMAKVAGEYKVDLK